MPISSQNNLGAGVTNANYLGVTSCYQCHIGGNKCYGVESGAGFGPYMTHGVSKFARVALVASKPLNLLTLLSFSSRLLLSAKKCVLSIPRGILLSIDRRKPRKSEKLSFSLHQR